MSTSITTAPSPSPDSAAAQPQPIAHPLLWLLCVIAIGLGLRAWNAFEKPFEVDEFAALSAVAERQGVPDGMTATAENPLAPVSSLEEVGKRSVLPYGIRNPVPLHNYLLYMVAQIGPITPWALRLPAVLAGVACVVIIFLLVRKLLGTEVALVAALLAAVDPIQIPVGWHAQPFALANLGCLLSVVALWGLLEARTLVQGALAAAGYALSLALVGYLDPVMLLILAAHLGMVGMALRPAARQEGLGWKVGLWLGGVALAALLLVPQFGYWRQVYAFAAAHSDYLQEWVPIKVFNLFWHNLAFLTGLLLVTVAGAVVRWQVQGDQAVPQEGEAAAGSSEPAATPAPSPQAAPLAEPEAPPMPEHEEGMWMTRLWVFLPQLAALVIMALTQQSIFLSNYLSFTTLGAAILVAYYATRDRSREVRLGVSVVVAVAMVVAGFWPEYFARTFATSVRGDLVGQRLASEEISKAWKDGDVILLRSGLREADFLHDAIPEESRPHVRRAILAPVTTLYPTATTKPVIPLTFSHYRSDKIKTPGGGTSNPTAYYDAALAAEVRKYQRFFLTGLAPSATPNDPTYLACLLPWLADTLDKDLIVARRRGKEEERYVTVKRGLDKDAAIDGLTENVRALDFSDLFHVARPKPPELAAPAGTR